MDSNLLKIVLLEKGWSLPDPFDSDETDNELAPQSQRLHVSVDGLKMKLYSVSISLPEPGQSPLDNNHHMFTMGGS